MANWDRANLQLRLQHALRRPANDQELTVVDAGLADELLGDAQLEVALRLAVQAPETNYTSSALTTADAGKSYDLTTAADEWIGPIEVYRDSTLKGPPMTAGAFWDCSRDYAIETSRKIRLTCGRAKSFSPFVRFFKKPDIIGAANPPVLLPVETRRAMVYLAAANFCDRGGTRDPTPFLAQYERIYGLIITSLKAGESAGVGPTGRWWAATGDLGRLG